MNNHDQKYWKERQVYTRSVFTKTYVGVINDLHFLSQFQKVYPQLEASRMSKTLFELWLDMSSLKETTIQTILQNFLLKQFVKSL